MSERPPDRTILIVEDEHQLRTLLVLMLESAGFRILEAAHPNEAAQIWKRELDHIDLVLADIALPGISGPELADFFQRDRPSVKAVFVTGMSGNLPPDLGRLVRNSEIVRKPFTREELVATVERVLEQ